MVDKMPEWMVRYVMIAVTVGWLAYLTASLLHHDTIPVPVWSIPGATFALLMKSSPKDKEENK